MSNPLTRGLMRLAQDLEVSDDWRALPKRNQAPTARMVFAFVTNSRIRA